MVTGRSILLAYKKLEKIMAKEILTQDVLQNYLSGLDFPTNKQAIINQAKRKNAPSEVVSALNGIPDRDYMDVEDLMKVIESR